MYFSITTIKLKGIEKNKTQRYWKKGDKKIKYNKNSNSYRYRKKHTRNLKVYSLIPSQI